MITEPQLSEIRNYLLSKQLPIDILIEVEDHLVDQIENLQSSEKLSFADAFDKAKLEWKKDLSVSYFPFGETKTVLEKRIKRKYNYEIFMKAFSATFLFLLLTILIAKYTSLYTFVIYFSISIYFIIFFPIIYNLYFYKTLKIAEKYKNLTSFYQPKNFLLSNLMFLFIYIKDIGQRSEQAFYIFSGNYKRILDIGQTSATILIGIYFFLFLYYGFVIISQHNFMKVYIKLKNRINFL